MKELRSWNSDVVKPDYSIEDYLDGVWKRIVVCTCGRNHINGWFGVNQNPNSDGPPCCNTKPVVHTVESFLAWYNSEDVSNMEIIDSIGIKYNDYIVELFLKGHYNSIVVCSCPKQHTTANVAKNNYPYGVSFICGTLPHRYTFKEWKAKFVDRLVNYNNMPKGIQLDNDDEATILAKKFLQDVKRIYKEPPKPPDTWIGAVVVLAMWLRSQRIPTDFGSNLELYEAPQKS